MHCFINKYYKKTGTLLLPVFLFLIILTSNTTFGQIHEFGIGVGGFNYVGDINPRYKFSNYRPGGVAFYRFNSLNRFTVIKLGIAFGNISGSEKNSKDPIANIRKASFNGAITEGSLMGEYNFINYRDRKQLIKFSPYLTAGIAVFNYDGKLKSNLAAEKPDDPRVNIAIPIGGGIKFILTKNWNLGTEFIARKSFTDYLDFISNPINPNLKSTGNPVDNDWYFYTGISLSYTIYGIKCPQEYKY